MKVISGRFRRLLALFFANLLILPHLLSTPAFAKKPTLSEDKKKIFAQNGLIFPTDDCLDGGYTTSASGTVGTVSGTDNASKVWNYFVTANIPGVSDNAAAIAGIMGNIQAESSFDPFTVNDGADGGSANMCTGLYQICPQSQSSAGGPWDQFKAHMSSNGFSWTGDHIDRKTLETDVDKAITAELDYLVKNYERFTATGWATDWGFLKSVHEVTNKTPEAYADLWNVVIEGAVGGESMIEDPVALRIAQTVFSSDGMYQASALRRQYARENFDRFSSAAAVTTSIAATGGAVSSGTGNYSAVLSAKNADKYFFNGSGDVPSAAWSDTDPSSMKTLLETYGDLAYQLGVAVGAPYIAILTQMRYEDSQSVCGANNFWGNGCPPGTGAGGASVQGKNLGEGFMQYGQTLTNGYHNQALGESDPKTYLEKIGPTWVQGDINGPGYASIDSMRNSVDALTNYINSAEGQAIVKTFGNYHASGSVNTPAFSWTDGWVSGVPGITKDDSLGAGLSEMPAASYSTSDKKPNKILLHYTEGTGNGINAFPSGSRYPSHFIVDLKKREGFQLLTADSPSVATVSGDDTSVQIEIVGFGYSSEPGYTSEYDLHNFSDADWDYLAVLLSAISDHYGIPLTTPVSWNVSGVEDQSTRVQSQSEFDAMTGIVGHMHSPPSDDHTDPGNIWSMVEAAIKRNPSASPQGTRSVNQCNNSASTTSGASSNGVTTTTYNGYTIAFPIAGATKDMKSQVSTLPCNHSIGCHYGPGVPSGQAAAAFDLCMGDNCNNQTVVSMTSGTVTQLTDTRNGVSCNHVRIRSEIDNTVIAYMHLTGEPYSFKEGDHINAGDIIGHISPDVSPCNDNSMAHVHIDKGKDTSAIGGPLEGDRDSAIVPMMNAAWNALPANQAELLSRQGQTTATTGGLTEAQAQTIASYYKSSAVDNDSWSMPINSSGKWNCFSFSAWWIQTLTTIGKLPIDEIVSWGEGARDLVHNFAATHSLQTGTTPRPYAVFSTTQSSSVLCGGSPCGHTGIVVAINGNDVTTIEAAYGATGYTGVEHRDISYFTNSVHPTEVFAYLDTVMDQTALNKILSTTGVNN